MPRRWIAGFLLEENAYDPFPNFLVQPLDFVSCAQFLRVFLVRQNHCYTIIGVNRKYPPGLRSFVLITRKLDNKYRIWMQIF